MMVKSSLRSIGLGLAGVFAILVAGCTAPVVPEAPPSPPGPPSCTPAAQADGLTGNWLAVRSQKGVAGELRTLFALQADGTMAYTEQLKRSGKPSQGLSEAGCWEHSSGVLTIQTHESNGYPVDINDPIYTNQYTIVSADDKLLRLKSPDGATITAKRMSPGYRLPF